MIKLNTIKAEFGEGTMTRSSGLRIIGKLNNALAKGIIKATGAAYVELVHGYTADCQAVHDNLYDMLDGQSIRNACLLSIKA